MYAQMLSHPKLPTTGYNTKIGERGMYVILA